jgi:hypothetical protein
MNNEKNLAVVDQLLANAIQGLKEQLSQAMSAPAEVVMTKERSEEFMGSLAQALENRFSHRQQSFVDFESASFELNYDNRIELSDVDLNVESIVEASLEVVQRLLSEFITIEE